MSVLQCSEAGHVPCLISSPGFERVTSADRFAQIILLRYKVIHLYGSRDKIHRPGVVFGGQGALVQSELASLQAG